MGKIIESPSTGNAEATIKSNLLASSDTANLTQTCPSNQDVTASQSRFIQLPSQGELSRIILLDVETGELISTTTRGNLTRGSKCGTCNPERHVRLSINNKDYMATRLIWKMQFGTDPRGIIIHRNGNPSDNSIANLSEVVR